MELTDTPRALFLQDIGNCVERPFDDGYYAIAHGCGGAAGVITDCLGFVGGSRARRNGYRCAESEHGYEAVDFHHHEALQFQLPH